ncbi:MAG TPA: hypothetical protein PK591_06860 [Ignavibacteriales bacterium]|nr:hypothetical protein [Ignavibacteriales bacterium]HRR18542.1 hypothetical protein [Ignavibacteriales bacterium]HRT98351.1 hypothetical protein [Ignavibacteriales bacterium]
MKKLLFVLTVSIFLFAQEKSLVNFDFGADVVSRYVWRGMELGYNTPHIQPWGTFTFDFESAGKVDFGFWASYGLASESSKYSENDFNFKYSNNFGFGTISLMVNDYYYPYLGQFSNFEKDGNGSHTIEVGLSYEGTEELPLRVLVTTNVHNMALLANGDKEKTLYAELGYNLNLGEVSLSPFVGVAQGESLWHQVTTDKVEVINVGFTASKSIKITDAYSLPVAASWIWNPHLKTTYTVFKVSL